MNSFTKFFSKSVALFACFLSISSAHVDASHNNFCRFNLFEGQLSGLWPLPGRDYRNTRTNPLEFKINKFNVDNLVREWDFQINGSGVAAQPTYSQGIAYIADSTGSVYAIDVSNGQQIWKTSVTGESFFTSPTISEDRVYVAATKVHAFDKLTGALLWSTPLYDTFANDYASNTTVVDGLVIVGVGTFVFDLHSQGRVVAFDKDTGERKWVFAATSNQFEENPEFGPGAGVWGTIGIDRIRKLAFVGTGQTLTGTASPYTDSILAINYCTGELEWSYSFNPNDVWNPSTNPQPPLGTFNHDVSAGPNLFTVWTPLHGFLDLVGVASKSGEYKIFKREQSNPNNVQPLVDIQLDPGSDIGAIQGTPAIHDGVLYIASAAYVNPNGERRTLDELFIAGVSPPETFFNLFQASLKTLALDLRKLVLAGNTHGVVPQKAVIWQNVTGGFQLTNPITYANGVIYQTSPTGFLRALDKNNGNELWRTIPIPPTPTFPVPGILSAGVTVVNGKVLLSYGFDQAGVGQVQGGLFSYTLPDLTFNLQDEIDQ